MHIESPESVVIPPARSVLLPVVATLITGYTVKAIQRKIACGAVGREAVEARAR
jgi:hypothetical protein